jgi:hypothetical protein
MLRARDSGAPAASPLERISDAPFQVVDSAGVLLCYDLKMRSENIKGRSAASLSSPLDGHPSLFTRTQVASKLVACWLLTIMSVGVYGLMGETTILTYKLGAAS